MLAAALAAVVAQALSVARAEVELEGPLDAFELATPRATLAVAAGLAAGERRRAILALPAVDITADPAVRILGAPQGGRARFVAWVQGEIAAWEQYPPATRARPRGLPERDPGDSPARPPLSALLVAVAWLPLALAARRRPLPLAAASVATAAVVAALVATQPFDSAPVRLLEGDVRREPSHGGRNWLEVLGSRGSLAADPRTLLRVEASAAVAARIDLGDAERGPLHLSAAASPIFAFASFDAGERSISPEANRWDDLDDVWTRSPGGDWSAHGPWALGAPLPPGREGAEPPGWLNPALPMGTGVLIARLHRRGPDAAGRPCETWLRVLGFGG